MKYLIENSETDKNRYRDLTTIYLLIKNFFLDNLTKEEKSLFNSELFLYSDEMKETRAYVQDKLIKNDNISFILPINKDLSIEFMSKKYSEENQIDFKYLSKLQRIIIPILNQYDKNGNLYISVYDVRNIIDSIKIKNIIVHELNHYRDDVEYDSKNLPKKDYNLENKKDGVEYYNHPSELNVYYNEMLDAVKDIMRPHRKEILKWDEKKVEQFILKLINDHFFKHIQFKDFLENISKDNYIRFINRLTNFIKDNYIFLTESNKKQLLEYWGGIPRFLPRKLSIGNFFDKVFETIIKDLN